MSNSPSEVWRISREYGIPLVKVADAIKRLGHTDGKIIADYINQRGHAVIRKVSDGKGGRRLMTEEEFDARFKKQ